MRRVLVFAILVPMTMVMVVACGSDDSEDSATTTEATLTTDEFLAQGNAICEAGNVEIDQAFSDLFGDQSTEPTPEQLTSAVNDVLEPSVQGQIDDLGALSAPEDLQGDVDQMLSDAQTALDSLVDDPALLTGQEDPFADVNTQATEIGLTACAADNGGE